MPEEVLQRMFNERFLRVVREVDGWVMDHVESDWSSYMYGLRSFGVRRGGWFRSLFRRNQVRIVDPVTLDQFADRTEFVFVPPHELLKYIGRPQRWIFIPRGVADKMIALGLP